MSLSDEAVQRFQLLYEATYGRPIDADKAREMAQRLLTLYALLLRPQPKTTRSQGP